MSDIKAIIFDCFGVIYADAVGNFYNRRAHLFGNDDSGLNALDLKIDLGEINHQEYFTGLNSITGLEAEAIRSEVYAGWKYDPNLVKLIKRLKKSYKIGLLSNAGEEEIATVYRDKLDGLFDSITVSYETGTVKPSPEIFLTCLQRLGIKPDEAIFIDDNEANLTAARKLNIQTIHYPQFGTIPADLIALV